LTIIISIKVEGGLFDTSKHE